MAKDVAKLKEVWFRDRLPMLHAGGAAHINASPAWKGWTIELDRTTNEVVVSPPRGHDVGRVRVPLSNVLAYSLSM